MKSKDVEVGEWYAFARWPQATPTRARVTGPAQRQTVPCMGGMKSVLTFPIETTRDMPIILVEARMLREPWSAHEQRMQVIREFNARTEAVRAARRAGWGDMPERLLGLPGVAVARLTPDQSELVVHVNDPDTARRILDALSGAPGHVAPRDD